jgi:omega-6 fatty acid desaturase (delta-12 desaturase)
MEKSNIKQLRSAIRMYARPSTKKAMMLFLADISVYLLAITGVFLLESMAMKILCSVLAGLKIASLFAIAHDAAHDSFTSNKLLNKIIARISFLPVLHNYSLWLNAHNRSHHQTPNVKGHNSWSPLAIEDYNALTAAGKLRERFYRHPTGIWFNYLLERWWKNKFIPFKSLVGEFKTIYWLDLLLVVSYTISYTSLIVYAGTTSANFSVLGLFILSFFSPVIIGSYIMGFTVYAQHTHESIPWFISKEESDKAGRGQEDLTMYMRFPHWYNLVSHNAMEHTVHHVDPRVPSYNLAKAQRIISSLLGDALVTTEFSFKEFLKTMNKCKLYDYENHCWLDFNGNTTSQIIIPCQEFKYADAA